MNDLKEALDSIHSVLVFGARDWAENKHDAWLYGIIAGWDDELYEELSLEFKWTKEDTVRNKRLNKAYEEILDSIPMKIMLMK